MAIDLGHWKEVLFYRKTESASLAFLRFAFGMVMLVSLIRFWANGWIEKLYLEPSFHFHYGWFPFIEVPGNWTYLVFFLCGLSALFFAIGFKYRWSIVSFFLLFTYIEFLDKTTYLNHYYFVSVLSFMLIWLPAHSSHSIDARRDENLRAQYISAWQLNIIKGFLGLVYIYAGLAKLNSDWMLEAMPLAIWLPSKFEVPILGSIMHERWLHYLFSWAGAAYDLFIVFFLLWRKTRPLAFFVLVVFHLLTRVLFPIGMFPFIMIACAMIFFSGSFHRRVLDKFFWVKNEIFQNGKTHSSAFTTAFAKPVLLVFFALQILLPWRHLVYGGNLFWHEQGYRYSWRVMLMEKAGYANFKIVDSKSGNRFYVNNNDFLSTFQEKQMATQPDFILEYGKYLGKHFESQGHKNVAVYVESYVALNGRPNQVYVNPETDLMQVDYRSLCQNHLTPFKD